MCWIAIIAFAELEVALVFLNDYDGYGLQLPGAFLFVEPLADHAHVFAGFVFIVSMWQAWFILSRRALKFLSVAHR